VGAAPSPRLGLAVGLAVRGSRAEGGAPTFQPPTSQPGQGAQSWLV